jgi:hypothetical protein
MAGSLPFFLGVQHGCVSLNAKNNFTPLCYVFVLTITDWHDKLGRHLGWRTPREGVICLKREWLWKL